MATKGAEFPISTSLAGSRIWPWARLPYTDPNLSSLDALCKMGTPQMPAEGETTAETSAQMLAS